MATLATLSYGHTGDFVSTAFLSIWNDEELVRHHRLPSSWPAFGGNSTISISSDGEFVCVAPGYWPFSPPSIPARIYSVSDGSFVEVPLLVNKFGYGPFYNVVTWSPRNMFVGGNGEYAYDPYTKTGIVLPGPSPEAKQGGGEYGTEPDGYSVLAAEGLLVEARPVGSPIDPAIYPLVVKDLYTGLEVKPPPGMAGHKYAGARPCTWHDDTGIRSIFYQTFDLSTGLYNAARVIGPDGFITHVRDIPGFAGARGALLNGALFGSAGAGGTNMPGVIVKDDGSQVRRLMPSTGGQGNRAINMQFYYRKTLFLWGSSYTPGALPMLEGIGPSGEKSLLAPPMFTFSLAPWGELVNPTLISVMSATTYRDFVALDGEFWTNRRYANETIVYE